MTFTIEPILLMGADMYEIEEDGWTVRMVDGEWAAQEEHTVLVTETGYDVLTLPTGTDFY